MTSNRFVLGALVSVATFVAAQHAFADMACDGTGTEMCSSGSPYCARSYSACRTIGGRTEVYSRDHQDQVLWTLPQSVHKAVVARDGTIVTAPEEITSSDVHDNAIVFRAYARGTAAPREFHVRDVFNADPALTSNSFAVDLEVSGAAVRARAVGGAWHVVYTATATSPAPTPTPAVRRTRRR